LSVFVKDDWYNPPLHTNLGGAGFTWLLPFFLSYPELRWLYNRIKIFNQRGLMRQTPSEISFKFQYVQQGYARGFFATKGIANDREIILGKETLNYDDITNAQIRDNRLILSLASTANPSFKIVQNLGDRTFLVLQIYGVKEIKFKKIVNAIASIKLVDRLRREAIKSGEASAFHALNCPE